MEETNGREDLHVNMLKQNTVRAARSLKLTSSGKSTPRGSPSFRRLRTPRKEVKSSWWKLQLVHGNQLVLLLILITLWAYIGFYVQSKWAVNDHNKLELVGYRSEVISEQTVMGVSRTIDALTNNTINSTSLDTIVKHNEEILSKRFGVNLITRGGRHSFQQNVTGRNGKRSERRPHINSSAHAKAASAENALVDERIPRKNTSYGLLVGPFGKTEDSILGRRLDKRKGTCDRDGVFGKLVQYRKFVLIFHELSMTGAPLSMMELATEILSCGGKVSVVVLNRKGGLMNELNQRGIKVLKDKSKFSYKIAMRADLIIAGSAVSSSWIEQYLTHFTSGSSQILWWIMENRREYFDRSKHLLNKVKLLTFLSDSQSKQWLAWCKEEHIQLQLHPMTVPLSVNDELACVAGIHCFPNTSSFNVRKMLEKRKLLRLAVRDELGLSDKDMLVVSLSSVNPGKGQLLLLKSVLLRTEQKLPLIDFKINGIKKDRNITDISQDENQHQSTVLQNIKHKELEDIPLRTKNISNATKKKRKISRTSEALPGAGSVKSIEHQDFRRSRTLLLNIDGQKEQALKILIGSVGSKSNKVLYVKEILRFISLHSNLTNILLWTPATTRVSSLYAAADVYVINAQGLGETFGRVTIEAMAFGLPILGTNAGGTREIVDDKITGLLHPIGREGVAPLARNLQYLYSNPSAREQLGKNGRLKVEKMYLKHQMYKKLADAFIQCMKVE